MINEFDILNGFLIEKGDKVFTTGNRSFKYGDGIFETIKVANGNILFWDYHYERISLGIKSLKFDSTNFDSDFFKSQIEKLISKNYYQNAKFRLFIYRDAPGLYTPMGNRISFFIEGIRLDNSKYDYNKDGVDIGLYSEGKKGLDIFSNCKTTSALLYVMASIYKKEQNLAEVIILNSKDNVCEASASNVFLVKNNIAYTPKLSCGPVMGVMRSVVIGLLKDLGIQLIEKEISVEELENSDEIFLTNTLTGVQGVKTFNEFSKINKVCYKLQEELSKIV